RNRRGSLPFFRLARRGHGSCRNRGCGPRRPVRRRTFMRRRFIPLSGLLAAAVLVIACGTSSDAGITTKVKSRLETDRTVDAAKVEVTTQNKVVTLSGAVSSPESRTQAVALARQTEGVKNVVDKLTIAAPQPGPPPGPPEGAVAANDEAITSAVRQKLASKPDVAAAVAVDTRAGVVTLSGVVPTQTTKQEIIQIARDIQGVQKVEDHLTVRSS